MSDHSSPVLVIMAAGMGSRFGGLKQIRPVDDKSHILMDFSIYDAMHAGFGRALFIIRREIEREFRDAVGRRTERLMDVTYAYQELTSLPEGSVCPPGRTKPWGTTHAIWCCRDVLHGARFMTVNADDFYGAESFRLACRFLTEQPNRDAHAAIGYDLTKTLSENGMVSRGVCATDAAGQLVWINERKVIRKAGDRAEFTEDGGESWTDIPRGAMASMNLWAFHPGFLEDLTRSFEGRLAAGVAGSPMTFEETLSDAVQNMLTRGAGRVQVLSTTGDWIGMTYRDDESAVREAIAGMIARGAYPESFQVNQHKSHELGRIHFRFPALTKFFIQRCCAGGFCERHLTSTHLVDTCTLCAALS